MGIGRAAHELSNPQRKFRAPVDTYTPAMPPATDHRRIGVLGGTFDPPHVGHLVTAVNVGHLLALDVVLLVVANDPWQKSDSRRITPAAQRLAMVQAAVRGVDGVEASDLEVRRGGPSYSAETMAELRLTHPDAELFMVLGADAAAGLHTWQRSDELAAMCELIVVDRPGTSSTEEPEGLPRGFRGRRVEVPRLEVSSTDLRARAIDGRPLRFLVPDPVIALVCEQDLYGERR